MCRENSFHTIKFSTDRGYATGLNMRVYFWEDEIEGNEPVMVVEYKAIEYGNKYNIVNNEDKFGLYIDGKRVDYG